MPPQQAQRRTASSLSGVPTLEKTPMLEEEQDIVDIDTKGMDRKGGSTMSSVRNHAQNTAKPSDHARFYSRAILALP